MNVRYRLFIELGVKDDGTFERGIQATGETPMIGDGDFTNDALVYAHASNALIWQSKSMADAASIQAQWAAEVARVNALPAISKKVH